jgi:hypothetical protein
VNTYTGTIDVFRLQNVRDRKWEKRYNPMFTGVRVPDCDFVGVVRMRETKLAIGDSEEAVA